MPADTTTADAFAAGQREAREGDRVALVTALGMDPATTWKEALEEATGGVGKMQDHVRAELVRHLRSSGVPNADSIDGGASDGDEYDFTGAEILQAMSMLEEHVREEGRREGMEAVAAVLDDGFDPWPAVKRTVNVDAMDHRARGGLDAILDAVIADACRAIRALSASPESAASRYSAASDAGIAREGASEPIPTTIYDVEGDL